MELYNEKQPNNTRWTSEGLPVSRPMTWYKATFKTPSGADPVVVDMQGMGKGHAWVNGNSLGRFWPSFVAGSTCGNTYEGNTLELSCQGGRTISEIQFASFGDPQGTCGSSKKGSCEAANALSVIQKAYIGKEACAINVSEAAFGSTNCSNNVIKRLAVQAAC
ncbi:hypothetical protein RJ639_008822 [Escallonia herrerae]|uniref:SUEL-type lectin domain-containing protein n=1 Tax=Escallonia herrerae TaxID=1293975 RepID=A0AA88VT50_9ASTE|nr:hypothetical protein RJ639_008822 [Escallonia herrerae]